MKKEKSVISIQTLQNEYLIRIIHRIRNAGFTNSNTKQDEHMALGKEIRRNNIGEDGL